MRYLVLATDYDGTLATDGQVEPATIAALERLRASGRRLLLVTGRELEDLGRVFPRLDLFDRVVAENGAVLHDPHAGETRDLAEPADPRLVTALRERGVEPLSVGRVIVATWEPHEATVLEEIRRLGLELEVIFNKGAVMVLPAGVTKASGLAAALAELGLSAHNAVGVGDAENDHAFLASCEAAVAVGNALPALRERADLVTRGDHGSGVRELAEALLADDLAGLAERLERHRVPLGSALAGDATVSVEPYGRNLLLAGPSGSGKSTLATGLVERLAEAGYQVCLVDPEGDYQRFDGSVVLGGASRAPTLGEALEVLARPDRSLVLDLLAVPLADRPAFFQALLPRLQELRARTARPHWLVVDEAHHLLPADWQPDAQALPRALEGTLLVTVHPERVSPAALGAIDTVLAVGSDVRSTLEGFARAIAPLGGEVAVPDVTPLPEGAGLHWSPGGEALPFRILPPRDERHRHRRKYAAGSLPDELSFHFRGPDSRLNLRAQNLELFVQLAEGVDDATWLHHLRRGDYSTWMRSAIKDEELADAVAAVERGGDHAAESRRRIRGVIEERYTRAA